MAGRAFGKLDAACEQERNGWREAFPQGILTLARAMKFDIEAGDRAETVMRECLIPFDVSEGRSAGCAIARNQIVGAISERPAAKPGAMPLRRSSSTSSQGRGPVHRSRPAPNRSGRPRDRCRKEYCRAGSRHAPGRPALRPAFVTRAASRAWCRPQTSPDPRRDAGSCVQPLDFLRQWPRLLPIGQRLLPIDHVNPRQQFVPPAARFPEDVQDRARTIHAAPRPKTPARACAP